MKICEQTKDLFFTYWTEIIPIILAVIFFITKFFFFPEFIVSVTVVKDFSSIVSQILGGFLGLFIASYTVLHGINFREILLNAPKENKSQIIVELKGIFEIFKNTVYISSLFLVLSLITYFLSSVSSDNPDFFKTKYSYDINFLIVALMIAFVFSIVLSLKASLETLEDLKSI